MTSNDNQQTQFSVAIIGGGIAGLCLAIGLEKRGIQYHIYEAAHKFSEIGAGVGMMPAARRAMELISPDILKGYNEWATINEFDDAKDIYFQYRLGMDFKGQRAGTVVAESGGPGQGISMIHRAYFLEELVKLVPKSKVTFGARVHDVTQDSDNVTLHFSGSDSHHHEAETTWSAPSTTTHRIAIACDGIKSSIRHTMFGQAYQPVFSGIHAYRGLIPMSKAITALNNERQARTGQIYIGPQGHVLTAQVEQGAVMNVVAFHSSSDGKWHHGDKWVVPLQREQLHADFKDWSDDVQSILKLMEKPDTWALFEHPPLEKYWVGRVALIGDAAHATTPHNGAGAGMAIEDAYILSEALLMLSKHTVSSSSAPTTAQIEATFSAFDQVRRPRTQKLVKASHDAGELYELHGQGVGDDLALFKKDVERRYNWIWDEDLREESRRVRELVEKGLGRC